MSNPFQQAPPAPAQQAPAMISDTAAQQFAPQQAPVQTQQFPGQVTPAEMQAHQAQGFSPVAPQQPSAFTQAAAPEIAQMQNPVQQFAPTHVQQATGYSPTTPAQGLPGQPWSPQQHQQSVPQAYAPPVAPPVQQQPAQVPQGFPQAPFPGQQGQGFPGAPAAQGGGFDPSMFGDPSAGGGNYPKVRDLNGRLCLFRVKNRSLKGTKYKSAEETTNYVANVAVLDGGPLYSSPADDDPTGVPVLVSETVPYVIGDLTIGQAGLKNRLKQDYVRGRIVRMPMGEFEKNLMMSFPDMEAWQALWTWLSQDPAREGQLKSGTYFWGIVIDNSPQADQLVAAFAQNPVSRELML